MSAQPHALQLQPQLHRRVGDRGAQVFIIVGEHQVELPVEAGAGCVGRQTHAVYHTLGVADDAIVAGVNLVDFVLADVDVASGPLASIVHGLPFQTAAVGCVQEESGQVQGLGAIPARVVAVCGAEQTAGLVQNAYRY